MKITEKKQRVLRKIYGILSLTTVLFIFQACYGTPEDPGDDVLIRGIVVSAKTDQPVAGIRVSVENQPQYQVTGENGQFRIYASLANEYRVKCEDMDQAAGGAYLPRTTILKIADKSAYLNISLDDK